MMKIVLSTFACLVMTVAVAEKQPFERYQSIVDRQMFGPLPPGFDPTKLPSEVQKSSAADEKALTQEQEKLKSAVHFSVVNVASDGQAEVGFTDNSDPKAPKHYFMKVGESKDGWTVKEADAEKATMTIVKDEIEVSLTLGGNSATDAAATARAGGAAAGNPGGFGPSGQRGGLLGGGTLRARRLQRQQAAAAEQARANAAAAEKEAAREAERQAQAEQEKAQREQERAEQRQQLLAIQEELKKVREAKAAAEAAKASEGDGAQD